MNWTQFLFRLAEPVVPPRFVIKRLLLLIPVLFGVASVVFAILHLAPGDPAIIIAGQRASAEQLEQIRVELGLRRPLWEQYLTFLWDAARFDFGQSYSISRGNSVRSVISDRLPITLELAIYGQAAGILLGLPLGIISAVKQDSLTDHVTRIGALTGISVPIFWSGPLLILLFSTYLDVFPTSGRIASTLFLPDTWTLLGRELPLTDDNSRYNTAREHRGLPLGGASPVPAGGGHRRLLDGTDLADDALLDARSHPAGLHPDRAGEGSGRENHADETRLPERADSGRHRHRYPVRDAAGRAVLTETVFGINGMGLTIVTAIGVSDYPVVQGTVLTFALLFTLVNLFVDVTYSYLDPRIQQ